jgi:DNA-binding GntR family transcriptional regulator
VQRIADGIQKAIRSGQLVPGQRLIEADLAAEYGVKRGPVRDALRFLAGDGIIELVPQRGARVRKLDAGDLTHMMPVLGGLVRTAVTLAFSRLRSRSVKSDLETAMQRMRNAAALGDLAQFQLAGIGYQRIIHECAANPVLDFLHGKMHGDLFYRQLVTGLRVENWDSYVAHFEEIHAGIMAGDLPAVLRSLDAYGERMIAVFGSGEFPAVWR